MLRAEPPKVALVGLFISTATRLFLHLASMPSMDDMKTAWFMRVTGAHPATPLLTRFSTSIQVLTLTIVAGFLIRGVLLSSLIYATQYTATNLDNQIVGIIDAELSWAKMRSPVRAAYVYVVFILTVRPIFPVHLRVWEYLLAFQWAFIAWRFFAVGWSVLDLSIRAMLSRDDDDDDDGIDSESERRGFESTSINGLMYFCEVAYWFLATVVVAENTLCKVLGVSLTSAIAGLGVYGLAVTVSGNAVLADAIAGFTIYLDRTVKRGEYIIVEDGRDISGTVISTGWKSVRLRSAAGQECVISNRDMAAARLKKFSTKLNRTKTITVNIDIFTNLNRMDDVTKILGEAIEAVDKCELSQVYMDKFDTWAHVFQVVFRCNDTSLDEYRECIHLAHIEIARRLSKAGIHLAIPYKKKMTR